VAVSAPSEPGPAAEVFATEQHAAEDVAEGAAEEGATEQGAAAEGAAEMPGAVGREAEELAAEGVAAAEVAADKAAAKEPAAKVVAAEELAAQEPATSQLAAPVPAPTPGAEADKKPLSRKEVLAKADARGPQGDMLETFRAQPAGATAEAAPATPPSAQEAHVATAVAAAEGGGGVDAEAPGVEDSWEDQADSGEPQPPAPPSGPKPPSAASPFAPIAGADGRRQYTRDYIIKLRDVPASRGKAVLTTEIVSHSAVARLGAWCCLPPQRGSKGVQNARIAAACKSCSLYPSNSVSVSLHNPHFTLSTSGGDHP
jgi:hypothetical protein